MVGQLKAAEFAIHSTTNRLKGYSLGQLVFGCDMIIPIKHTVDWELIRQQNQTQINKYDIRKNRNQVEHAYNVGYKVILNNHTAYKNETPYRVIFVIMRFFTNGRVNLKYGPKTIRYNIHQIKPYKSDTNFEDINPKNMCDYVNI